LFPFGLDAEKIKFITQGGKLDNSNNVDESNLFDDPEELISNLKKQRRELLQEIPYTDRKDRPGIRNFISDINRQLFALQGHI
jgi:hypothetical protein